MDKGTTARLHFIRQERDHALAAAHEAYLPRMKALYDEWSATRERIWEQYEEKAREVCDGRERVAA